MKKIAVIFLIIGLVVISGYVLVRHSLSTPDPKLPQPKDASVQTKPPQSFLDIKPKLVAKLQDLVKKGSNGLYNLFVHEINPDVLNSTVSISQALLVPDTAAMKQLQASGKLPGILFKIKTDSIQIDGLGIKDILSKDVIDVKAVHILHPTIELYTIKTASSENKGRKTLYQQLMNQMKHIGIGTVSIEKGTLIHHSGKSSTKFNDIAIHLSNVVIDSTTQFDKSRFLFAKDADLTMKDYAVPTSNHLYTFKVGVVSIRANQQLLVAKNVVLQPHYGKNEFQQHVSTQTERYQISIPSIVFRNTNWWQLINHEVLQAGRAEIDKADVKIYLDRRKPSGSTQTKNFPHQMIMRLPLKINIEKLKVNDLNLTYEEFSTLSGKTGNLYVNDLHGTITNLTNLPEQIKRNNSTTVAASGVLMHVAPADLVLRFDLSNYKTGVFSAELNSKKGFDGTAVNPIAEPLGLFMIKKGTLKSLSARVSGDNYKASGTVVMIYDDLHITPLKKDPDKAGGLRKKSVTSFFANTFLLKDANPSKGGEVRKVKASFVPHSGTFFNLVWKTVFVGILKTIGAPEKLAYQ